MSQISEEVARKIQEQREERISAMVLHLEAIISSCKDIEEKEHWFQEIMSSLEMNFEDMKNSRRLA